MFFFETTGLKHHLKQANRSLSIFEMGFGTGLNYLLLLDYYKTLDVQVPIHFYSVEAFPASLDVIEKINYPKKLNQKNQREHLLHIFKSLKLGWNSFSISVQIPVTLHLFYGTFDILTAPETPIDYFFHDPFSPEVNQELWTPQTFQTLADFAQPDALLATYCAASKARACMAKSGWIPARAKGALGKREMTLAALNEERLTGFKTLPTDRLIRRFDAGDFEK
jgi:tRNA U34 5-methylaminomethyl-2-thiouridine-forming methyltransferase MnmC